MPALHCKTGAAIGGPIKYITVKYSRNNHPSLLPHMPPPRLFSRWTGCRRREIPWRIHGKRRGKQAFHPRSLIAPVSPSNSFLVPTYLLLLNSADQMHDRILAVAASYGRNDGSSARQSVEKCARKFLELGFAGDVEAAKAVAAEKPEIFVDLMGHTTGARWASKS